jgi:hypothetical protein
MLVRDIAVRVLIVWFHALGLGLSERGGRTRLQSVRVNTTHRRVSCYTYALVREGFSR